MPTTTHQLRVAAACCLHDDATYLPDVLAALDGAVDVFVFVSRVAWDESVGDWASAAEVARACGATVVEGEWSSEAAHRMASHDHLLGLGYSHALIIDSDEVLEPQLRDTLLQIAEINLSDRVYTSMRTYWKSPAYVISPPEPLTPLMLVNLTTTKHEHVRDYSGGRALFLGPEYGLMHHLSYAGPDERILRKVTSWTHRDELVPGWYEKTWLGWDGEVNLRNLHPTHPPAYAAAVRREVPDLLREAYDRTSRPVVEDPKVPTRWPSVLVVIPLHGGEHEIRACLDALRASTDLIQGVVVVDNASPDGAADIASGYDFVSVTRLDTNLGFAAACNLGAEQSTSEIVVYLNSDAVLTRAALIRLIEPFLSSGAVGATGPYSNNTGHFQQLGGNFTSLEDFPGFARDFSGRDVTDLDVDMLVGLCLAVRRSVHDEIGGFDPAFGIGTFEDNDLCYRILRSGYRLVLARRSYVFHFGSKTMERIKVNMQELLAQNHRKFLRKWSRDLETGFASNLSGLGDGQIRFEPSRKPEHLAREIRPLVKKADISLCMIVRDEEARIRDCIESIRPFVNQIIVVDTGSTDRTIEILHELGVTVIEHPWEDSFSAARNVSLKYATGRNVLWLDADDTVEWESGMKILEAAAEAPSHITAFIIPVRFTDEGPAGGTQVDHIKLIRRFPGLRFELRIHEQILPSIREHGGQVVRLDARVMHTNYDTSEEGQRKKRIRDKRLLALDLEENPNHPFVLFNVGMTAFYLGEFTEAIHYLQASIAVSDSAESHLRKAYALLVAAKQHLDDISGALVDLNTGLKTFPDDPELQFRRGLLKSAVGDLNAAREAYEAVLGVNTNGHLSSIDTGILSFKTQHNLASVYDGLDNYPRARDLWQQALASSPTFLASAMALLDSALRRKDLATAQAMVDHVRKVSGPSDAYIQALLAYGQELGGERTTEMLLQQALQTWPGSINVVLGLSRFYLNHGFFDQAIPLLQQLQASGVAEGAFQLGTIAIRQGRLAAALKQMERALELNPGHEQTLEQVAGLRSALGISEVTLAGPVDS